MSLILEALRKSEAERRLGSAPDVLTAMPVLRAPAPRRRWPLASAGTGVLVAMLALGWWWMHAKSTIRAQPLVQQSSQSAASADAGNRVAITVARDAAQPAADVRKPQPPPTIRLPMTSAPQVAVPIASTAALSKPPPSAPASANPSAPMPASIKPAASEATAIALTPNTTTPAVAASVPAPAPHPSAEEPALLSLADLAADERNNLPKLKVSMHVYADDPAQRFMIVDGQRVGEGARIADGVILVRIRRDGAEIDAHGRRLLLQKP